VARQGHQRPEQRDRLAEGTLGAFKPTGENGFTSRPATQRFVIGKAEVFEPGILSGFPPDCRTTGSATALADFAPTPDRRLNGQAETGDEWVMGFVVEGSTAPKRFSLVVQGRRLAKKRHERPVLAQAGMVLALGTLGAWLLVVATALGK
jgi:hypothetical protein